MIMQKQILLGINLNQERTIKEHCELIKKGIDELLTVSEEEFKINLAILQNCYEKLERKLLN